MTRLLAAFALTLLFTACTPQQLPRECVYRTPDGTIVTGACP